MPSNDQAAVLSPASPAHGADLGRIVFYVDVDGVLTCLAYQDRVGQDALDPGPVGLVASLVRRFSALVVVSSTWRRLPRCRGILVDAGLPAGCFHPDWATPILPGSVAPDGAMRTAEDAGRGGEISAHVLRNGVARYVVFDDVDCGPAHAGRQVRPDPSVGLTPADAGAVAGMFPAR